MPRFYYVYVLRSLRDGHWYVGFTHDLRSRLRLQSSGAVKSTSPRRPVELIFYEAYRNEYDAKRRESHFKTSKGKNSLQVMLGEYLRLLQRPEQPHQRQPSQRGP
jgi:putative endonuclease